MATNIFNKANFIKFLQTQMAEDKVIVFTSEFSGDIKAASPKWNFQKVGGFSFAGAAFKKPYSVEHLARGKTTFGALMMVDPEYLTEKAIDISNEEI